MSDEADSSHRSDRCGETHECAEPASGMPAVEQPAARWVSLRSSLCPDEVRRRLSVRLARGTSDGFQLAETKSGFLIRWVRRRKVLVAELALVPWKADTQIHVTVPAAAGAREQDLDELRHPLESAVE